MKITIKANKNTKNRKSIDVTASTKSVRHSSIMAGAGAGLTIRLSGIDANTGYPIELIENSDGSFDTPTFNGTIDIESIGTYYDGGSVDLEGVPCKITLQNITEDYSNGEPWDDDYTEEVVQDLIASAVNENIRYGGGWVRVTFKGDIKTEVYADWCAADLFIDITDDGIIQDLDRFANGENIDESYEIYVNDNPTGNIYDTEESAIKAAKANYVEEPEDPDDPYSVDEVTVVHHEYLMDFRWEDILDFGPDDVVWNSNDHLYA